MIFRKRGRQGKRRERHFAIAAALLPFAILVLVELSLRVSGYGSDERLFIPFDLVPGYLRTNDAVAERYFVSESTLPTIPLEIFKAEKGENTVRVFVQGGSSAAGFPYYFGAGLADQLEPRLSALLPDRDVEVIGTAMAAVTSYTLLDLSEEIVAQEPDAVVIYAGHNEFYGALGIGSSESLGGTPMLKRLYLKLRPFRLIQALRTVIASIAGSGSGRERGRPPGATLMERMVGEQAVPYQSGDYRAGIRQFESNLAELLEIYAKHSIPVILGTLTSNVRDQAPFVDGAEPGIDPAPLQNEVAFAARRIAQGDTVGGVEILQHVVEADSIFATGRYALGRTLLSLGDSTSGRDLLYEAKDRDQLRFRAPEVFNQIIRQSARKHPSVHLAEVQASFDAAGEDGVTDSTLMTEHLHPNLKGYRLLTDAFVDAMIDARLLGLDRESSAPVPSVTLLDSLIGEIRLRRLKGSWPFKPAGSFATDLIETEGRTFEEARALEVFREERQRTEVLEELRKYYVGEGRFADARDAAVAIAMRFPFLGKPLADAGDAAMAMGRLDEALSYYDRSLDREESGIAHRMAGTIILQQGDRERAIPHLKRALELEPGHPQSLYNLAGALALSGDVEEARTLCETLLAKYPEHQQGRRLLESLGR